MAEAEDRTVAEDSTAAVVFMEAEGLAEAGAPIAADAGMAAELDGHTAAGCNAEAGGGLADIRLADIADMGEQD